MRAFLLFLSLLLCCRNTETRAAEVPTANGQEKLVLAFYELPLVSSMGYIIAKDKGFYQDAGLPPVEIIWRDEVHSVFQLLEENADFAVSWMAEGIMAKKNGADLVAISRLSQGFSNSICVRRDRTPILTRFDVFEGQKIGLCFRRDLSTRAFFLARGVKIQPVVYRPEGNTLFRKGGVDGIVIASYMYFIMSQYVRGRDQFRTFKLAEYGGGYPEDTLFCRESFLQSNPDICKKFVNATFRGWRYAMENKEESVQILSKYEAPFCLVRDPYVLEKELTAWGMIMGLNPELSKNGDCSVEDYNRLCDDLVKADFLKREEVPEFGQFFRQIDGNGGSTSEDKPEGASGGAPDDSPEEIPDDTPIKTPGDVPVKTEILQ